MEEEKKFLGVRKVIVGLMSWRGQKLAERLMLLVMAAAILGAIIGTIYVVMTPKVGEKFTEFYLLDLEGKAIDYPQKMKTGEPGRVRVGIINHEQEAMVYRLAVEVSGVSQFEVGPIKLADGEMWEEIVPFTPDQGGAKQKVAFLLYRHGENEPYRDLYLWVEVVK